MHNESQLTNSVATFHLNTVLLDYFQRHGWHFCPNPGTEYTMTPLAWTPVQMIQRLTRTYAFAFDLFVGGIWFWDGPATHATGPNTCAPRCTERGKIVYCYCPSLLYPFSPTVSASSTHTFASNGTHPTHAFTRTIPSLLVKAAWCIANATSGGTKDQLGYLIMNVGL